MQISLADSVEQGFKRWSDIQKVRLPPTTLGHLAVDIEGRCPVPRPSTKDVAMPTAESEKELHRATEVLAALLY